MTDVSAAFQLASHQLIHIQRIVADPQHDMLRTIIGTHRLQRLQLTCIMYSALSTTTMVGLWYYSELPNVIYTWQTELFIPYVVFLVAVAAKHWMRHPLGLGSIPLLFRSMASFYGSVGLITSATLLLMACSGTPRPPIIECVALMLSLFNLLVGAMRSEFHKYARCCEWVLQRDYGIERVMLSDVIVINQSILHQLEECTQLLPDTASHTKPRDGSSVRRVVGRLLSGWDFIRPEIIDVTHKLRASRQTTPHADSMQRRRSIFRDYRGHLQEQSLKKLNAAP